MRVIAAPGLNVPREDNPRKYITDAEPVDIDMTGYYIRRMSAGELVEVADVPASPTSSEVSARAKK